MLIKKCFAIVSIGYNVIAGLTAFYFCNFGNIPDFPL